MLLSIDSAYMTSANKQSLDASSSPETRKRFVLLEAAFVCLDFATRSRLLKKTSDMLSDEPPSPLLLSMNAAERWRRIR